MEIENYIGTLNDTQIAHYCANGILISKNYNNDNLHQACYELSAGNIYYDISQGFNRIDINEKGFDYILIKPKQSVVIITKEELSVPLNVIGRVLIPHSNLTFSTHDNIQLKNDEFVKLLETPKTFFDYWKTKRKKREKENGQPNTLFDEIPKS